jgi:hypothetical protein
MLPQLGEVSTVRSVTRTWAKLGHPDLGEQVIDIGARHGGRADDGNLAGQRIAAADAVDLQVMAGAHDREKHGVTIIGIGGKVRCQKERSA